MDELALPALEGEEGEVRERLSAVPNPHETMFEFGIELGRAGHEGIAARWIGESFEMGESQAALWFARRAEHRGSPAEAEKFHRTFKRASDREELGPNVLFFDKREARPGKPWTETPWVYDLRTGRHFTLKRNPLRREHLDDFVKCHRPGEPRSARIETERFRPFSYDELIARDKVNLDITWLKDPSLDDADALLPPEGAAVPGDAAIGPGSG